MESLPANPDTEPEGETPNPKVVFQFNATPIVPKKEQTIETTPQPCEPSTSKQNVSPEPSTSIPNPNQVLWAKPSSSKKVSRSKASVSKQKVSHMPSTSKPVAPPTPEPMPGSIPEPDNTEYTKTSNKSEELSVPDRSKFIKLKKEEDSEEAHEEPSPYKLTVADKVFNWEGSTIYNNLPESVMTEYDKMMRESHELKVQTLKAINKEFPVNYDYNPHKSRIRTNYADPQIAKDRTKNNIASRRSRQRKKFQTQMVQLSIDYDLDDNFLLEKEAQFWEKIIHDAEKAALANDEDGKIAKLLQNAKIQCGLTEWIFLNQNFLFAEFCKL